MAEPTYVEATVGEILNLVREQNHNGGGASGSPATQRPEAGIDPTKNVSDQLQAAVKHIFDIITLDRAHTKEVRDNDMAWSIRLDAIKDRAESKRVEAEAGRIDALRAGDAAAIAAALQTASTAALALQNQVTTSASALAATAAITKDTQDKAIAALQLIQAQSGGTLSGREVQKSEGQDNSSRYVALAVAFFVAVGTIATIIYTVHALTGR